MSWWTTVLGGAFGFMLGGPLGAMLGAAFAGNLSKGKSNFGGFDKDHHLGDQQRVQAAFFSSLFSVMGYIAKVDGKVSKEEILLAQQVMQHMQLADDMQKVAKELFNQGKHKDFNLDEVLEQFRVESHRRTHLVRMFLEIQIQATYADGVLDDKEHDALKYIAQKLHFPLHELENLIQQFNATKGHTS
ncbi:MAG: co-chaperone DjlA, partial [Candidatus Thioglobus sp.]